MATEATQVLATDNPVLDLRGLPRFADIRPEQVEPALDYLLAQNRAELERLFAADVPRTWANCIQPLEDMDERLARMWSPVSHLNAVVDSAALRAAYNACLPKLSDYSTEVSQDERVYGAYKAVAAGAEFARLNPAQRKIITNALRDFRLAGAELAPADKQRFKEIQQELATLTNEFAQNVLDATNAWSLTLTDEADLAGLPESAVAMARQQAERDGVAGWKFTLHGPSYIPFLSYADKRELRRQMYTAYVCRASDQGPHAGRWDNGALIVRILRLRRESARLLGYPNYAEYSLVPKMAENVAQVMGFLTDLAARARPVAERELAELREFARADLGAEELEAWDIAYYAEKLRKARYDLAQEDLRPYFPEPVVRAGMFEVVRRLYGLSIREIAAPQSWHPDVRFFEIADEADEVRGRFYIDLYARAHKRGGAWMDDCITRKRNADGVQVPVAFLVCNFSPPLGDQPALFTHEEVLTLFHEFGHGLHHLLSRVDYYGVSGMQGVAWDAVELPSQFMENWCWERAALDLIARHHVTGAALPAVLYERMLAAKNFQAGMQMVRQLEFALFDMRVHAEFDPDGTQTVQQLLDAVRREVAVTMPPAFNRFQNGFSHIFAGGYAAGYYSYKWAEVLSADAYSRFEEAGVFDRAAGRDFMQHILEQGGVREPLELFVAFRGRAPRIDALLRHSGLAA